jgi:hypothetical protein
MSDRQVHELSRALAKEALQGVHTSKLDKRLRRLFQSHWDGFNEKRGKSRRLTLWFDKDQYLELRRQILLSGKSSLTAFLIGHLRLNRHKPRRPQRAN